MIANISKKMILVICVACLLFLTGCSKLTPDNYDQLKIGMNYDDVVSILGNADECDGAIGVKNCVGGDEKKTHQDQLRR